MSITPQGIAPPAAPTAINIFFLKKASFGCIMTTRPDIDQAYDHVISVPLEGPRDWQKMIIRGPGLLSENDNAVILRDFDEKYYYIDVRLWDPAARDPLFMVLKKKFADGHEYRSDNLLESLHDRLGSIFLLAKTSANS